ncbi:MAG: sulfatase-like hydrolase/transferase [Pirellulales bacterium]|nr:sulfatase-like hydrolase/transferase [Pirellulales bacterium]
MKQLLIYALTFAGWAIPGTCVTGEDRPNLVFLLADDQCTYSMGCYGTPVVQTPNMDQLSRDGLTFDNHYDTTAICMASRANVMTGMYEYKTGCNFEHGPLLREHWQKSYPMLLKQAGYSIAFAGKFGFEVSDQPGQKGSLPESEFDRWGGGPGQTFYETRKNKSMAKYAAEYPHSTLSYGAFGRDYILDAAKQDQPFCLSISFKAPHKPATADPTFANVYQGKSFVKPANYGRIYGEHFAKQSRQGRQYERFHSWNYSDQYDQVMATYYQQIYAIDVALGMIRKAIAAAGVTDNTVIIYTSDNGFMCGSHGYGSKVLPYEEASRVPLIMYDPRHPNSHRGLRTETLTGNVDFAPTLLELAGIDAPENMDGKSLVAVYDNPQSAAIHPWLPLINVWGPPEVHSLSVVTKDWKYIHWPYSGKGFQATEELYNTRQDPLEKSNLIRDTKAAGDRDRLRSIYDRAVKHWQATAVPYHNYRRFGDLFDRD